MAHLLVVEDNADVRSALRIVLEDRGYRVTGAESVAAAVRAGAADAPDVILLDLTLPDGDGLEVLTRLTSDGRPPPITLALTGRDEPDVRRRCLDAGCHDVLVKPVPPREIVRRVAEALDVRG
jgi:two-component system KDP operon response regulator KdpE